MMANRAAALFVLFALTASCSATRLRFRTLKAEAETGVSFVPQLIPQSTNYTALALSPNAKLAIVGDDQGLLMALNTETGQSSSILRVHTDEIISAVFLDDNQTAVTVSRDGSICYVDVPKSIVQKCAEVRAAYFAAVGFSSNRRLMLSGSKNPGVFFDNTKLRLWDLKKDKTRLTIRAHEGWISAVDYSPDGRLIASYSEIDEEGLVVHDTKEGEIVTSFKNGNEVFGFDETGRLYLVEEQEFDGPMTLYSWRDGDESATLLADGLKSITQLELVNSELVILLHRLGRLTFVNPENGTILSRKESGISEMIAAVSEKERKMLVASRSGKPSIELWDLGKRSRKHVFEFPRAQYLEGTITRDNQVLLAGREGVLRLDMNTGIIEEVINSQDGVSGLSSKGPIRRVDMLENHIFTCGFVGNQCEMLVEKLKLVEQNWPDDSIGENLAFSEDARRAARQIANSRNSEFEQDDEHGLAVMNLTNNKLIGRFRTKHEVEAAAFSDDGTKLLLAGGNYEKKRNYGTKIRLIETDTGQELLTLQADKDGVGSMDISPDGRFALIGGGNHRSKRRTRKTRGCDLVVLDLESGKKILRMSGHTRRITSVRYSPDQQYALSISEDGTARIWRLETGESVILVYFNNEWLLYTDDGYFDSSRHGHGLVAAVQEGRTYSVDQLALSKNRPDIILDRMGFGSKTTIDFFQNLFLQRLGKHGLKQQQLASSYSAAPHATITRTEKKGRFIELTANLSSDDAELTSYQIYANGVPLLPGRGMPISGKRLEIKEKIELVDGRNLIEVSASDSRGIESLKDRRIVQNDGRSPTDLYFLGFGVSSYEKSAKNLKYADKDVVDLKDALEQRVEKTYRNLLSKTFINKQVTVDAIKEAKRFLENAGVNDMVIVFVAGHGTHVFGDTAEYYYLTYNADQNKLQETAASFSIIEDLLRDIAPRRKLLLIDTCESGEWEAKPPQYMRREDIALLRSLSRNRQRYVFNDLLRRTGAIVFSSSRANEFSYESKEWKNGAFTSALLRALADATVDKNEDAIVTIKEIANWVTNEVASITADLQHPTVDRDNLDMDFGFRLDAIDDYFLSPDEFDIIE